jgi:hypothetical protein
MPLCRRPSIWCDDVEVHAPEHPILTLKQAAVHLAIVTAGVLIALSFEGILEWSHHRSLVREAKANLTSELQANKKELERFIGKIGPMRDKLLQTVAVVNAPSAPGNLEEAASLFRPGSNPNYIMIPYDRAELGAASRTTAEITGAFALMEYGEVTKYATVYDRQALFNKVQDDVLSSALSAASLGLILDFQKASPAELQDVKRQLRLALGNVFAVEEIGRALAAAYDRALDESN